MVFWCVSIYYPWYSSHFSSFSLVIFGCYFWSNLGIFSEWYFQSSVHPATPLSLELELHICLSASCQEIISLFACIFVTESSMGNFYKYAYRFIHAFFCTHLPSQSSEFLQFLSSDFSSEISTWLLCSFHSFLLKYGFLSVFSLSSFFSNIL